ncbi:MAG: hypothetical protein HYX26_08060 [Acidobacteriales bacterium]|nr:hypothetical protein [Terriglobales bacterium]
MHRIRRSQCLLICALIFITGCRKSEAPQANQQSTASAKAQPRILTVDPAGFSVSRGRVLLSTLRVTFSIANPERGAGAELTLSNPTLGVVATLPLNYAANGDAEWVFDQNVDLGPAVRLRADCPNGFTEEFVLGHPPFKGPGAETQIRSVTPTSWKPPAATEPDKPAPPPEPVAITVSGEGFHDQCRIQFRTGDRDWAALPTTWVNRGELRASVEPAQWNLAPITERVLRLKLVVKGPGGEASDTRDFELWEP